MQRALIAWALILSGFTAQALPPPVTVDEARRTVAMYIGHHAWGITMDAAHDEVRDGVRYYAVILDGTSEGEPQGFFVNSQSGDIYDLDFRLEQTAEVLKENTQVEDQDEQPEESQGD